MRKFYYIILILLGSCTLFSCKKGENIGGKTQNSALIIGKWLVTQQHTRVFDAGNNLLKDTTLYFSTSNAGKAWIEIYNTDGTAYVTTTPYIKAGATVASVDTTSYLNYSIVGSSLMLNQSIGGSQTDPILGLTATNMTLEDTYNGTPKPNWGLDPNTTYTFTEDNYFSKQ